MFGSGIFFKNISINLKYSIDYKLKIKHKYNLMDYKIIIFNKKDNNFVLCNSSENLFHNLKKREKNLLISMQKYENVNTYILGNNYIFIKIRNIRAVILKDNVYFFFNNICYSIRFI